MEFRKLGETDLAVSAITFGAWAAGGWMWGKVGWMAKKKRVKKTIELK